MPSANAIIAGISVLAIVGGLAWVYNHGRHVEGLEGTVSGQDVSIQKGIKNAEILVNRPDTDGYVDSLRSQAY